MRVLACDFHNLDTSMINLDASSFENRGDGTNWYLYASNNPLRFIDPTGLIKEEADGYTEFDNIGDSIHDGYENGGYESWEDAADELGIQEFYDSEGVFLDDKVNIHGDPLQEGDILLNKILEPTQNKRDSYLESNYKKLYFSEVYYNESKLLKGTQVDEITSSILETTLGEIVGSISKAGGWLMSVLGNTNGLGSTGEAELINDAKRNEKMLFEFSIFERLSTQFQSDFNYREDVRYIYNNKVNVQLPPHGYDFYKKEQ